jgi:DNA (cytosine-5)-methyltransferase 1
MIQDKKLTYIDLFSGCGGLSEGFESSGLFEGLAHVEWELPMVNTLRKRLETKWGLSKTEAFEKVIHFDIQLSSELIYGKWTTSNEKLYQLNSKVVKEGGITALVGDKKLDVIIGGPPCQAYSIAGRAQDKNSMKDDYRNYLFESYVEVVKAFRPQVFVFENVPGMLSAKPGDIPVTERIYEAFQRIGYEIRSPSKMHLSQYSFDEFGVPQKRKRVILIGVSKESKLNFETIYNLLDLNKLTVSSSVRDAIGHLPPLLNTHDGNDKFHKLRNRNERDKKIFEEWILQNMNSKNTEKKIAFYNKIMNKSSKHAKYRNLEWDKSAPTLVAHLQKDGLMFIHPDAKQARSISIREAANLQSFPEDFEFEGSQGYCYKMI